ncbi:MAG: UvrD-helicase domain-containing protein [Solirubrobacteraceae bacterium]
MSEAAAWTAEQSWAIEHRRGDLLLDASAGSGKTSVLVQRFVAHVLEDEIDVSAILTITFTDKAAAELRDRIRARLRERGAFAQARATEGAFISTIHGFCARVLRAGALAAGLDPGFVVLDSDQSEPLADAAFDRALLDFAGAGEDAVQLVADYGVPALRSAIRSVYAQLRARGQLHPCLPAAPAPPGPETGPALAAAARSLIGELAAVAEPGARVEDALGRLERCPAMLAGPEPWPAELDRLKLPGNGAALSTDACVAYAQALAAHRRACAHRAALPVRDLMNRLLLSFGRHYAEGKAAISGVDFEDLELLASELLGRHEDLRRQYSERFERIMVDELQDTNRVQLDLIEAIASDNLFTVGDAQQSIYRFRHADVELFEGRGARLEERGARATLQTNFRSHREILGPLNVGFASALGERFRPLVAGRPAGGSAGSEAGGPELAGAGEAPRVELLLVDKGADWELEGLAAPWRLAEARALAQRVAELVAAGTAPGQVVVLLRASTDMRAYERALEREGLPTYVIGGRGYWSHPQVLDLVAYLRVLANSLDEEALYTVLASPLVGASLDALVVLGGLAREQGRDPWAVLTGVDHESGLEALSDRDRAALDEFAVWCPGERQRASRLGVDELIDRALERSGYDLSMLALPGGRRRLANVRKLMRLGREHEREHGLDLRGFLRLAAERAAGRAGSSREGEAPVEGEGLDAVRLMTIHRAKGLEFHTVCVADLGRSARPPYEVLRVSADGRLGLRLSRSGVGGRVSALEFDALGAEDREAEEREERRLFYVAMTRAQERLILSGATRFEGWTTATRTGGGTVGWVAPAFVPELGARIAEGSQTIDLGGARLRLSLHTGPGSASPALPVGPPPASVAPPSAPPPPLAPPRAPPPPVGALSYSALGEYARCGYRFYAERVLGLPSLGEDRLGAVPVKSDPDSEHSLSEAPRPSRSAADRGVLIHAVLERLVFRRPVAPTPEAVLGAARRVGLEPQPTDAEAAELIKLTERFAASELCARLARATETRREERFAFLLPAGVLITGAIDVLAREPGGRMLIVDYKSDRLDPAQPAGPAGLVERTYATQRLVYALAALHTGAREIEVAYCFLEAPEAPVTTVYDAAQRAQLDARLAALADGVLGRRFPVSELPHRGLCGGCPAQGGLCSWPLEMTRREAPDRLF